MQIPVRVLRNPYAIEEWQQLYEEKTIESFYGEIIDGISRPLNTFPVPEGNLKDLMEIYG